MCFGVKLVLPHSSISLGTFCGSNLDFSDRNFALHFTFLEMADQVSSFVFPEIFFSEKQLPPVFNLETPAHMARFEVECKEVGERFLHRNWPHSQSGREIRASLSCP